MVGYQKAIREEPTRFEYVGHGGAPACRKPPSEEPWCRRQVSCLDAGSPPAPLPSPSCNADRSECRSRYRSYCIPFSTSLSVSSASALNGQPGRDPCFLALSILPHFCVAHGRQLTGGLLGRRSRRVPAVEHYLGLLVGEQVGRHLGGLAGRKVQRSWQVRVPVVLRSQHFEEDERVSPFHLRPQFVATDVRNHATSSPLQETSLAPLLRPRQRDSRRWWTLRGRIQPDEPSGPSQPAWPICRSWLCRHSVHAA